jgi:hypothetical protein
LKHEFCTTLSTVSVDAFIYVAVRRRKAGFILSNLIDKRFIVF